MRPHLRVAPARRQFIDRLLVLNQRSAPLLVEPFDLLRANRIGRRLALGAARRKVSPRPVTISVRAQSSKMPTAKPIRPVKAFPI
jgi:hypothetical protein